jgi:hypothetical protein
MHAGAAAVAVHDHHTGAEHDVGAPVGVPVAVAVDRIGDRVARVGRHEHRGLPVAEPAAALDDGAGDVRRLIRDDRREGDPRAGGGLGGAPARQGAGGEERYGDARVKAHGRDLAAVETSAGGDMRRLCACTPAPRHPSRRHGLLHG